MSLHRYVDPSYYLGVGGAFPGTVFGTAYDRINVTSGGTGGGGSANADGAKGAGPNAGTYFMAFGEDATSQFFNRGHRALAQNTDFLDDVVHRDLVRVVAASFTSVGDVSAPLNGSSDPVFVGNGGAAAERIFILVETNTNEPVYDPTTGNRIYVSSISGATIGTGFSTANPITLNFSGTVPTGVAYTVYHGRRQNLATHDNDLVTKQGLPAIPVTTNYMQAVLRGGLDARYRNARTSAPAELDTAGAGAIITRDGPAPTVDVADTTNLFYDPIGACWKVKSSGASGGGGFLSGESSGVAFVHYVSDRGSDDPNEQGPANSSGCFASVWPHDYSAALAGTPRTQIRAGYATGTTLNPAGVGGDVVQAGTGDFFYNGSTLSAVNCGYDMLEITRASGDVEVYVITRLDVGDQRRCYVRDLSGATPTFPMNEAVTLRWVTTKFWQGPSTGFKYELLNGPSSDVVYLGPFQHFITPANGHSPALTEPYPLFGARTQDESAAALGWAGYVSDASSGYAGVLLGLASVGTFGLLLGNGGIKTGGRSELGPYKRRSSTLSVSATGSQQWDIVRDGRLIIDVTVDALTLTLTLPGTYSPNEGDNVEVIVNLGAGVSTFTLLWPSGAGVEFFFSSAGDKTPTQGVSSRTVYTGSYTQLGTDGFLMTKTSFPSGGVQGP